MLKDKQMWTMGTKGKQCELWMLPRDQYVSLWECICTGLNIVYFIVIADFVWKFQD